MTENRKCPQLGCYATGELGSMNNDENVTFEYLYFVGGFVTYKCSECGHEFQAI